MMWPRGAGSRSSCKSGSSALAESSPRKAEGKGIELEPLNPQVSDDRPSTTAMYSATIDSEQRTAELTIRGPEGAQPDTIRSHPRSGL